MNKQHPSNPFQALDETEDVSGLSGLARKAHLLAQIDQLIDAILPLDIRPHVQVANVRERTLILLTDSPAWNTKVRFLSHTLLTELNALCNSNLSRIHTLTRPVSIQRAASQLKKKQAAVPSRNTAEQIGQVASQFEDDALREALQRLSRHMLNFNPGN